MNSRLGRGCAPQPFVQRAREARAHRLSLRGRACEHAHQQAAHARALRLPRYVGLDARLEVPEEVLHLVAGELV